MVSAGQFEVGCKTTDHYHGGMRANYTVEKCHFWNRQSETMLHQKKYYIAAVEMDWDYSPTRTWEEQMHHSLKDRYYSKSFSRTHKSHLQTQDIEEQHVCAIDA